MVSTWEAESGRSLGIQDLPGLRSELHTIQGYIIRSRLKTKPKQENQLFFILFIYFYLWDAAKTVFRGKLTGSNKIIMDHLNYHEAGGSS